MPRARVSVDPRGGVEDRIIQLRGLRVLLDADLAQLYGVSTGRLNEAVRRNARRFPEDFMFRLTPDEFGDLISQFAISSISAHGGRRTRPLAFTEQGVAMLSSVLRSSRAIAVNIEIMRAFVRLRRLHGEHTEFARRLDELEARYDKHDSELKAIFDAIRALMQPAAQPRRPIGFRAPRQPTREARSKPLA